MKKLKKISISMMLAASMLAGGMTGIPAEAATAICTTYSGENVENQNYIRCANPIQSYLTALADGSLMRVQYGAGIEGLLVEYYDKDYNIVSSKIVAEELPVFGGFYATQSNYFVVTGQENAEESAEKEVYRITKYDKHWNKTGSAGLNNCNTTIPFDAGSCRMDVCGKYLLIRTSHEMYQSEDGRNHQANVTMEVDMETMEITDSYTAVMNTNMGYVSHSFNQFIKVDSNKIVAVDHGDAYPRSLALLKYQTDVSGGKFVPDYFDTPCKMIDVLKFPGGTGVNTTGASVGGFEISDSNYLVAGNTVVQDENNLTRTTRNVFVAAVDKSTSAVTMKYLTSYEEGDGTTSTPQMVKLSNNKYLVLWSRDGKVYYTSVDGTGNTSDSIHSMDGALSDCVPVIFDGKIVWYTWNEKVITFYDIDAENLSAGRTTEIANGHLYENLGVTEGVATLKCSVCEKEEQMRVMSLMIAYWNEDGGNRWSGSFNREKQVGEKLYCWIGTIESNVNDEIEILTSDASVASVQMQGNAEGVISFLAPGKVTITIRPKYNPGYAETYEIVVPCENHSWDEGVVTKQPSNTEEGIKTFTCKVCGTTKTETITKLETPKPESPTPENPSQETPNPENPSQETPAPENPSQETQTPENPGPETPTPEMPKPETPNPENPTPEIPKPENPSPENPSPENPEPGTPNPENQSPEASGTDTPKPENPEAESSVPGKTEINNPNETKNQPQQEETVALNETIVRNGVRYKVIKAGTSGQAEVAVIGTEKKNSTVAVPDAIDINHVSCKVTIIFAKAFQKNNKVKNLVIGKNVKTIGKKAFYNCKKLNKVTINSVVLQKVGKQAIKGIHKKAVIKVPKQQQKVYKKLLSTKSGFEKTMKIKGN